MGKIKERGRGSVLWNNILNRETIAGNRRFLRVCLKLTGLRESETGKIMKFFGLFEKHV